MEKRLTCSEVPVEQTWKLEDIFASEADWEKELKAVEAELPAFSQEFGRLSQGA